MLTLHEFRLTRRWSDDLGADVQDELLAGVAGYLLEGGYCLEYDPNRGEYALWIGRADHVSTCIDELVKLAYADYVKGE